MFPPIRRSSYAPPVQKVARLSHGSIASFLSKVHDPVQQKPSKRGPATPTGEPRQRFSSGSDPYEFVHFPQRHAIGVPALASATAPRLRCWPERARCAAAAPINTLQMIESFEGTFGVHPGQRRNHIKGTCAAGEFVGTADAAALSRSPLFTGRPSLWSLASRWAVATPMSPTQRPHHVAWLSSFA